LDREGIANTEVDIERHPPSADCAWQPEHHHDRQRFGDDQHRT